MAKQDVWLVPFFTAILALIPLFIMIKIINYRPELDLFDKIKVIFGQPLAHLINFTLVIFMSFIIIFILWSTILFGISQYLTEIPFIILGLLFMIIIIYGVAKGIETIARTNEIFFIINFLLVTFIFFTLLPYIKFEHIKPILYDGIMPLIKYGLVALTFVFPTYLSLILIPKQKIINHHQYHWYLGGGILLGILFLTFPFFYIISIITVNLAELFRYPAYYVQYKIDLFGAFAGLENLLSLHWLFNTVIALLMGTYFISEYTKKIFKLKQKKYLLSNIIIIGLLTLLGADSIFPNSIVGLNLMKDIFPYYIAPIPLLLLLIMVLLIIIKKKSKPLK